MPETSASRIICPVRAAAQRDPDGLAGVTRRRRYTFADLERLVTGVALKLQAMGVRAGDRIAILSANSIEYVSLIFALARLKAVAVPLNLRQSRDEREAACLLARCTLIFCDSDHRDEATTFGILTLTLDQPGAQALLGEPGAEVTVRALIDSVGDATLVFTSGSSGRAKGVILSYGNHYHNALGSNENIRLDPGDCWLLSLPLCHVGGLSILYRTILAGAAVYISDGFSASEINQLIDSGEITHLSLVPTMLDRLISSRTGDSWPATLKAILLGGAPMPPRLIKQVQQLDLPALVTYGMTETASQVTTTSLDDSPEKLLTAGRPLRYRKVRIVDDKRKKQSSRVVGEIEVAGEVLADAYVDSSGKRRPVDKWLRTGDLGCWDDDGYLVVKGRVDSMLISGGEKIYPEEIAAVAESFPEVTAAVVLAVSDETWGQRPVLFVELPNCDPKERGKLETCLQENLARIKQPDIIIIKDELPRTAIGKISLSELRRELSNLNSRKNRN